MNTTDRDYDVRIRAGEGWRGVAVIRAGLEREEVAALLANVRETYVDQPMRLLPCAPRPLAPSDA